MLGIHEIWLFVLSGILLNITPGPDTVYVIGRSMQMGWRGGAAAAFGISCGCFFHVAGAAIGLSALLMASSTAFSILKLVGAAYLVLTGLQMLWSRPTLAAVKHEAGAEFAAAGFPPGRLHQRAQSQGRAVLPGLPASIRRSRRSPQAARVPDARPDLHLHGNIVVPGAGGVRGESRPPPAAVRGRDRLGQPRPREPLHLSRHPRRHAGDAVTCLTRIPWPARCPPDRRRAGPSRSGTSGERLRPASAPAPTGR